MIPYRIKNYKSVRNLESTVPISKFISNDIMKFCQTLNRIAVTVTGEIINYSNYHLTIIVLMTILLYSF